MDIVRVVMVRSINNVISRRKMSLLRRDAFIAGKWVPAISGAKFPVFDPATDECITEIPDMDSNDACKAVIAARDAFSTWKNTTAKERSYILRNWFNMCQKNADCLAEIITAEAGKPLKESRAEIVYANDFLDWFADTARHINGEIIPSPWPNKQILVTRHPVGVASVITPWNFPYAMITRKVAALMAAGCTCVIKPSEDTPLTALAAAYLAEQAGVPKGVINVVTCNKKNAPEIGKVLCEHEAVAIITFTGSTQVGRILYGMASKGIKRVALELGGNAPFIVFPSANIVHSVKHAMNAKFRNNGQVCIGANRFLIHERIYDSFMELFKNTVKKKCILGPGTKKGVTCGPLINDIQAKNVAALVDDAVVKGAEVILGGKFNKLLGSKFYEPTLLGKIYPDMRVYSEEIFGPVAPCIPIKNETEALAIANATRNGLASYVCTNDLGQAFRMSQKLEFGMVSINDGVMSSPEPPFGGVKEAGIGREGSLHGAEEYTDIKYTLMSGLTR